MSERSRDIRQDSRQDKRHQRRDDRGERRDLNQRLKERDDLNFWERRRIIRNRRKLDRLDRRADHADGRARARSARIEDRRDNVDRRVETPREQRRAHQRGGGGGRDHRNPHGQRPREEAAQTAQSTSSASRPSAQQPRRWFPPPEAAIYAQLQQPHAPVVPPRAWLPNVSPSLPIPVQRSYDRIAPSERAWEAYEDAYNATYDPIDPNGDADGVDFNPYDTEVLVDVGPGIGPDSSAWQDLAGEIEGDLAAFLSRPRFSGVEFGADLIQGVVEGIGQAKIDQVYEIATYDGWTTDEYEDAVGFIQNVVGSVLLTAAAAAPALPSLMDKIRERRREGRGLLALIDQARENGQERRADRAADRVADQQHRQEYGPDRGVLDAGDGTWGPAAATNAFTIRAKRGSRAAIVDLPGGYALVRTMGPNETPEAVSAELQAVAANVIPVVPAGPSLAGACACGCGNCGRRRA